MTAHVAPPGTNAELRFAWPPKTSSVKLFRIPGDGQQVPVEPGADLTFTLPQEPGTYIYYAHAEWEQGSGTFAFALDVKN